MASGSSSSSSSLDLMAATPTYLGCIPPPTVCLQNGVRFSTVECGPKYKIADLQAHSMLMMPCELVDLLFSMLMMPCELVDLLFSACSCSL